jgi:hypothetical protein
LICLHKNKLYCDLVTIYLNSSLRGGSLNRIPLVEISGKTLENLQSGVISECESEFVRQNISQNPINCWGIPSALTASAKASVFSALGVANEIGDTAKSVSGGRWSSVAIHAHLIILFDCASAISVAGNHVLLLKQLNAALEFIQKTMFETVTPVSFNIAILIIELEKDLLIGRVNKPVMSQGLAKLLDMKRNSSARKSGIILPKSDKSRPIFKWGKLVKAATSLVNKTPPYGMFVSENENPLGASSGVGVRILIIVKLDRQLWMLKFVANSDTDKSAQLYTAS